jgi:ribosomal protein S18 acetylase RimI-like enzyme
VSYEPLSWDSAFFKLKIGRVHPAGDDPSAFLADVAVADADGVRCLYLLLPADADSTLQLAISAGFRPYDIRIELERPLDGREPPSRTVRDATPTDMPSLERIARERFRSTRFFSDRHFPPDKAAELYVKWLQRGMSTTPVRRTLVSENGPGFIICHFDREDDVGTIELIGVAEDVSSRGLGDALVRGASHEFAAAGLAISKVTTQGRNVPALRLYQRHGYLTTSVGLWLHRWRNGGTDHARIQSSG